MRKSLLVAAAIGILITAEMSASTMTPFALGEQGGIIVSVTLNGKGPFKMLLDTGATHSAITADVAGQVGATIVAQTNVISPAGSALRPIVAVDSLSLGHITVDAVLPSVAAARAFDAKGDIKGLIGQDVLAGLRYTLDYERRTIEWHDAAPQRRGIRLALSLVNGRFLVTLPQHGATLQFVPDSGAGGLVIFEARCRQKLRAIETADMVEVATGAGKRAARVVRLPAFRIGDRTLRDVEAVSIAGDDVQPGAGDGLLPLHRFRRVTFDGPGRRLILG